MGIRFAHTSRRGNQVGMTLSDQMITKRSPTVSCTRARRDAAQLSEPALTGTASSDRLAPTEIALSRELRAFTPLRDSCARCRKTSHLSGRREPSSLAPLGRPPESHCCRFREITKPALMGGFCDLSGRRDSNPRPPDPQSGALPSCATSRTPSLAGASERNARSCSATTANRSNFSVSGPIDAHRSAASADLSRPGRMRVRRPARLSAPDGNRVRARAPRSRSANR